MGARSDRVRPPSIRGQLAILIAALAIPLIALQVWSGFRQYKDAEADADSRALTLADATATSIHQFLTVYEDVLGTVADDFGPGWVGSGRCDDGIRNVTAFFPLLVNAIVVRAEGEILCSVDPRPAGTTAESWTWLPTLKASREFTLGTPVLGTMSLTWILPLAAPIFGPDGDVTGAVVGSLPLLDFGAFLDVPGLGEGQLVTVATADRTVIARSHDADRWVGRALPPETSTSAPVSPGRSIARGPDFDGVERAWGQVEMPNGWTVYVGVPVERVFGPARAEATRRLATTLLILVVGILLAGFAYRRIARALRELATGVGVAAAGERVSLPEATPLEVREVVDRFNTALESRKTAEAAERAARERYQSIFDNAVFGLYVSTLDGRFLQVNRALAAMLGYPTTEALIAAGPKSLYPSGRTRTDLMAQATGVGRIADWEIHWLRADGQPITVRLNGRTVPGPDGEAAFEMIVQDITEERRTEEELRQTQKMEAIGKLAGGIAHDFNNLLTVIGGNLEMIEDALPDEHPLRTDVDQIREATVRAGTLTGQLLAFARREPRGERWVDVNEVLREMERLLVRLIGEDVRLETRLATDPLPVAIDPSELEQVIMNLALNARDALPMGGQIVIETGTASDTGGDEARAGDGVLLTVRDTGVGMDRETAVRIFEPFYTTKPTGEGTGLGLSTVYGILQRAGGHVSVESEPGCGTTFRVWFPFTAAEVDGDATEPRRQPRMGGCETILVAEDEDLVRGVVCRALEDAGYRVVAAFDGQHALETIESLPDQVDLVLTDVVMPRMQGTELAERLVALRPDLPVLYMSGYLQNQALSDQLRDHPDILLRKPFSAAELCERVRSTLDLRRAGPR